MRRASTSTKCARSSSARKRARWLKGCTSCSTSRRSRPRKAERMPWISGGPTVAVVATSDRVTALSDGSQLFAALEATAVLGRPGSGIEVDVLFNPDLETAPVLVPALAGIVLVFVGTFATSLGVVRERQAGTMEQLAVMPLRPADVLLGKLVPYVVISLVDLVLVMTVAVELFDVPFEGSVWLFALGAVLFLVLNLA